MGLQLATLYLSHTEPQTTVEAKNGSAGSAGSNGSSFTQPLEVYPPQLSKSTIWNRVRR
jgi:hypothetical protein